MYPWLFEIADQIRDASELGLERSRIRGGTESALGYSSLNRTLQIGEAREEQSGGLEGRRWGGFRIGRFGVEGFQTGLVATSIAVFWLG